MLRDELIRDAIANLSASDGVSRARLYRCLSQGVLFLASATAVDHVSKSVALEEDTSLSVLSTQMPDGGNGLLAFTDAESVRAYDPNVHPVGTVARDVLTTVVDHGYDALIINPAGPWALVPRQDVLSILSEQRFD